MRCGCRAAMLALVGLRERWTAWGPEACRRAADLCVGVAPVSVAGSCAMRHWFVAMSVLCMVRMPGAEPPVRGVFNAATGLHRYAGCMLKPESWADGDSFSVLFPDGTARTIRLYGVDCFETSGEDETDARRLRAQRRYFGISGFGGGPQASNDKAKELGRNAGMVVEKFLAKRFTVHTAWSDARGNARYRRYYAFVTTADGRDLAELLVEGGLARAFGVYRRGPHGTADEYRERLRDLELRAAKTGAGVWAFTDWERLPEERKAERDAAAELETAKNGKAGPTGRMNPNSATRDELMRLPGIGEKKAYAIIEGRDAGKYRRAEDLMRVSGIGTKTVESLRPFLTF